MQGVSKRDGFEMYSKLYGNVFYMPQIRNPQSLNFFSVIVRVTIQGCFQKRNGSNDGKLKVSTFYYAQIRRAYTHETIFELLSFKTRITL